MVALLRVAAALYAIAFVLGLAERGKGRRVLGAGVLVHLAATMWRGFAIDFFPLTNKMESFSAAALCTAVVVFDLWRPSRVFLAVVGVVLGAEMAAAVLLPQALATPPPLMRTLWYPLHVPLSFLAYGLWTVSAADAVAWAWDRDPAWLGRIDRTALQGFALWSLAMICGGVWGVLAWGAYFMWDPKIIWSVILWFHYATFVHLHLTPSLQSRAWVRPVLAGAGLVFVFVAYVGTSFLFGRSSHAF
jgi:ABC-type transport system involved in cytochrome c biogenesis permease subunit